MRDIFIVFFFSLSPEKAKELLIIGKTQIIKVPNFVVFLNWHYDIVVKILIKFFFSILAPLYCKMSFLFFFNKCEYITGT
jgi:hypothetical protein